jgi:hypothetical protein
VAAAQVAVLEKLLAVCVASVSDSVYDVPVRETAR